MMTPKKIIYNAAYVEELKELGNHKKASAFLIYLHDINIGIHETKGTYSPRWGVGKTTAWQWIKDFNEEIDNTERNMF